MRLFPAITILLATFTLGCGWLSDDDELSDPNDDEAYTEEPVVDPAADVVEVPAVPCAGQATHFPAHGTQLFLVFHDAESETRFQWVVDNVRRSDDGAYCEVASGKSKGAFVPMSCLQPVDGTTAPTSDCPVAVTCLYRSESGNDCATGTRPVAGPANDVSAEDAYRLASTAYQRADRSTAPAAPVVADPSGLRVDNTTTPPTLTNVPSTPAPTPPTTGLQPVPPATTPVVNAPAAPTSPPLPSTGA